MPDGARVGSLGSGGHEWLGAAALAGRDLIHAASGCNRAVLGKESICILAFEAVAMLDEEPVVALLAWAALHAHEYPAAPELLSGDSEFQIALSQCRADAGRPFRHPEPAVPEHDGAAAVFAFGDRSFKVAIIQGMVFHLHGQSLVAGIARGSFGDRP